MNKKIFFGLAFMFVLMMPVMAKTDLEKLLDKSDEIYSMVTMPSVDVYGTDYFIGETNATTFLQLLNVTNEPITNSTCFVSIWNPDQTPFITNATMTYLDEGLFYRDYNLPQTEGVYMISAKCTVPELTETIGYFSPYAVDGFEGGWTGGTGWNNGWAYGVSSVIQTVTVNNGTYALEQTENALAFRSFDFSSGINMTVSFWARFYSIEDGEYAYFIVHDGTENIINSWTNGDDDSIWRYYEYNITGINPTRNTLLEFKTTFSSGDSAFYDDVQVSLWKANYTETYGIDYQQVSGSGEVHVIDPVSTIINSSSFLNELMWNFQFDRDNPELLSNHDYCIDNMTLGKTLTFEYCYGSDCRQIQRNETIPCDYGCNTSMNTCNANPFVSVGIILGLILGFSIFIWEVLKRT